MSEVSSERIARRNDENSEAAIAKSFHETRSFGQMSIDSDRGLVRFKNAVKFQPTAASTAGKVTAAVFTGGLSLIASAAIEHPRDKVVDFCDVRGYQLIEDDSVMQSGGFGAALVGGVLFGPVGAVAGSMGGSKG